MAVFAGLFLFTLEAHAARTITASTLNGGSSVTVAPGATITAVVNVTTDGSGAAARWRSTGWLISTTAPGAVTCVDHLNHDSAGSYSETFSISAPATPGTYNAYFIAYNNDSCGSGASPTHTMANAVIVVSNPVPTTTSISPTSKNVGDATFTLTVNGTNFVPGSVVQFAGSARTTTYVSATQLTATIPASDLTAVGTFNITVFNPAPGGGTSNAQTFTVTPASPSAVTDPASGITSAAATVNGTVSSNGASTDVSFDYGLTAAYGSSIAATPSPLGAGAVNTAVSAALAGLNCNTTFHYRVVATNSAGTTNGLDGTFTTGACSAPYPATACAATRFGNDLGCTANDVSLTGITLVAGSTSPSCVSGTPVTLDLDLTVNFASPNRWDVGIFIANDGKLPTLLPANGGASSCSVDILPITAPPFGFTFPDLDGVPQGTLDTCGDGNSSINFGTGSGIKRMTGVTLPCYASATSGGQLFVPFVVSWDNQKSPTGSLCTSNLYPVPNTTSKCNAPASSVSIAVVVLPVITKTNGGTEINPGANTTYTVVINNNSGGTLLDMVFTDPVVTNLSVTSMSCAAAGGSTCPAMTSAAMITAMQGAGITIPSASLPNNSTLTFTINATLSPSAPVTDPATHLINTATVTLTGGGNTSASDDDTVVLAPSAAKSFSPGTITEGASSVLTVTLTNPTASAVTGVAFTDTYPAGLVNTPSAGGATTCGGTVTAANDGNSLALSGGTIPASGSCTVTVNVTSATAGSYNNNTGTVTHASGTIPAASATLTVNVAVYGAFNACDVGTCVDPSTIANTLIKTKIAGSSFSLDIIALKNIPPGSWNTNYSNNVLVELLDASDNGPSDPRDVYSCPITSTVIATLAPNPSFSNPDNGLITVGPFIVANAYRDVRVRVTNVGGTTKVGCSTDRFAIRPASFDGLTAKHLDWENPGTGAAGDSALGNLSLAATGMTAVHKAGRNFYVGATAVNSALATTVNYAGSPTAILTSCAAGAACTGLGAGCACTATTGSMTLPGSAVGGIYSTTAASYAEVGAFALQLQDTSFAVVDATDTAADCTASGRYICSSALDVGRFVPDHFAASMNTPAFATVCASGGFTYVGQPFAYATAPVITVEAQNFANAPTAFYTGNWWRITGASLTGKSYTSASGALDSSGITGSDPAISDMGGGAGTLTFGSGTGLLFTRTTPVAPFDAEIRLQINVVDADGVVFAGNPASFGAATAGNGIIFNSGKQMRFGRLRLSNAFGSSAPLRVPVEAQYWSGMSWVINSGDSCTALAAGNLLLTPAGWPVTAPGTLSAGKGSISLTPTGPGNVAVCADLGADPVGGVSCAATTSAGMPWLQSRWPPGASYDNDPSARATFGIYAPETQKTIHVREHY